MGTISNLASRGFYIGLAIGQIILTAISTSYVALFWMLGQNAVQTALILVGVVLVGFVLLGAAVFLLMSALRLPDESTPEQKAYSRAYGRKMGLRFGLIVLAEFVIIMVFSTILDQTNHGDWVTPVIYFIVGLHFIPLAFVFHVRAYNVLGAAWMIITVLTVALTPATLSLGQGISAWVFWPVAGCGLATWVVVGYILIASIGNIRRIGRSPALA